jgi:diguanylate cyclase (GGDEF)-like protein/PAS domain S-box-containing protein
MRVSVIPLAGVGAAPAGAVVTFDDVTHQLDAQEHVARSEERFRKLAGIAPVAVFETDATGVCDYVNERWCEFSGAKAERAIGVSWIDSIHHDDRVRVHREWLLAVRDRERFKSEFRYLHTDGHSTSVYCEAVPIVDDADDVSGWIGSAMDVTAELALREGLRDSEARFRLLVEHSQDVVLRIHLRPWRLEYASPSVVNLTGWAPDELYADPAHLINAIHPDDLARIADPAASRSLSDEFECRIVHRDSSIRTVEVRRNVLVLDGTPTTVEVTVRDITRNVAEHDILEQLAHRDELTGLPNRRALMGALDGRLAARQPTSVIFLDLDGFKVVNDTHGHDVGDDVLKVATARLVSVLRDDDFVARLGGDEFVVIARPEHSEALARRVVREFATPLELADGRRLVIGISAGVTNVDAIGPLRQSEVLLQRADAAMYEAKRRGKGQVVTST